MSLPENASHLIQFLNSLRAVRYFRPDPIPQDVIDAILKVARWSGSASNVQPWELVVVREHATLEALATAGGYAGHVAGAAAGIVLVFTGRPGYVTQETYDEGRLSERIMLAAQAYGVGSCIGWFVGEGPQNAKSILNIPEDKLVRTVISLGYPDEEARRNRQKPVQARKPISTIVHWDRY